MKQFEFMGGAFTHKNHGRSSTPIRFASFSSLIISDQISIGIRLCLDICQNMYYGMYFSS